MPVTVAAPPADFMAYVAELFKVASGRLFEGFQFWVSTTREDDPGNDGEWMKGFPHCHEWGPDAVTMICYLNRCEGGNLVVFRGEHQTDPVELAPSPGLCAFCSGHLFHGVRPITGPGDRLALIVTGYARN